MRRSLFVEVAAVVVLAASLAGAAPALAKGPAPVTEERRFFGWLGGSATDPIDHPELCGERVGGEFFLNVATSGDQHVTCVVRSGVPLVGAAGGAFSSAESRQDTDASLEAMLDAALATLSDFHAVLDGQELAVPLERTGVYTIHVEPGSFISQDPAFAAGQRQTRVTAGGAMVHIDRLPVGSHTLVLSDQIDGEPFQVTFSINVVA